MKTQKESGMCGWEKLQITDKQRDYLRVNGFDSDAIAAMDRGSASKAIEKIIEGKQDAWSYGWGFGGDEYDPSCDYEDYRDSDEWAEGDWLGFRDD